MSDVKAAAGGFTPHLFRVTVGVRMVRLNFYTGKGRMNWHKDDYNFAGNPSRETGASLWSPIVSNLVQMDHDGSSLWRKTSKSTEYCLIQSHRQPLNSKLERQFPSVPFKTC